MIIVMFTNLAIYGSSHRLVHRLYIPPTPVPARCHSFQLPHGFCGGPQVFIAMEDYQLKEPFLAKGPCRDQLPFPAGGKISPRPYIHTYIHTNIHTYIHTYITYITYIHTKHTYIYPCMHTHTYIHHITLHYITLHYTTLHYTTLHYITLHTYTHIHTYIYI